MSICSFPFTVPSVADSTFENIWSSGPTTIQEEIDAEAPYDESTLPCRSDSPSKDICWSLDSTKNNDDDSSTEIGMRHDVNNKAFLNGSGGGVNTRTDKDDVSVTMEERGRKTETLGNGQQQQQQQQQQKANNNKPPATNNDKTFREKKDCGASSMIHSLDSASLMSKIAFGFFFSFFMGTVAFFISLIIMSRSL